MGSVNLSKVTVRNKLNFEINNCQVKYCASDKLQDNSGFSYVFDWRTVDVESEENVKWSSTVDIGTIHSNEEQSYCKGLECSTDYRGYWQVYWTDSVNGRYKLSINNAQVNVWQNDDKKEAEITLIHESDDIRVDFKLPSGNAYFYAKRSMLLK